MEKIIIGLVGPIKAGKTTIAEYLEKEYHALCPRYSDPLFEILKICGQTKPSRGDLQWLSTELRGRLGENLLAKIMFSRIQELKSKVIVLDGVRRFTDVELMTDMPEFILVSVDTDPKIRWQRMVKQDEKDGDEDKIYEQFLQDEKQESELQIRDVMAKVNYRIDNNSTLEKLYQQVGDILYKIDNS